MQTPRYTILQTLSLLLGHELRRIICVTGRETLPFIEEAMRQDGFQIQCTPDALSAGFMALGQSLESGKATAVVVDDGSALLSLQPALLQASHQKAPILVIAIKEQVTADISASYIGKEVRLEKNMDSESETAIRNNLKINEAILETHHRGKGVSIIHMSLDSATSLKLRKELLDTASAELPKERRIERIQGLDRYSGDLEALFGRLNAMRKRLVIIGQMNYIYMFDRKKERLLDKQFAWVVEHSSNRTFPTEQPITHIDEILYPMSEKELDDIAPELVITMGGESISRRLKYYLKRHKPMEHWHVSPDGELRDDFQGALTLQIEMDPFEFMEKIADHLRDIPSTYPGRWKQLQDALPEADLEGLSLKSALGRMIKGLPKGCTLHLSGGSVTEQAQLFDLKQDVEVLTNYGISQTEGQLLTMAAYARCSDKINFLAIGDLCFMMDARNLWGHLPSNMRILLLNNKGSLRNASLPSFSHLLEDTEAQELLSRHNLSAETWCRQWDIEYWKVESEDQLGASLEALMDPEMRRRAVLVEVCLEMEKDRQEFKDHFKALKSR